MISDKMKYYPVRLLLMLSAFALFSCGKDDDNPGGGPGKPGPDDQTTLWESNSLHFAKLFGNVRSVDEMFGGVNTVEFDRNGYLTSYNVKGQDAQNNPIDKDFRCTYNAGNLVTSIASDDLTIEFGYGTHGKYVEVEQDIFAYNEIKYLYVFQPKFLKNLTAITLVTQRQRLKFEFTVNGNLLTVKDPDGNTWSESTYTGAFPAQRTTRFSGEEYKTDEDGNYIKEDGKYVKVTYTAVATETFRFNTQNGNLLSYVDTAVKTYEDNTTKTEESRIRYNDDRFNTVAQQGSEVFTYDEFGDYTHIESSVLVSDFTYTRDTHDNWYDRTETTVMFGQTYTFRDQRTIVYY